MAWPLFYLLAALHPVAFIIIGLSSKSWRQRLLLWALLPVPAVLYCWDYFVVKYEHVNMCAAEGGLKVLIQPEGADRVRMVGERFNRLSAEGILETYYPKLQHVEVMTDARNNLSRRRMQHYMDYTATPNKNLSSMNKLESRRQPKLIFQSQQIDALESTTYEISVHESESTNRSIKEAILSKGGKIYAKHTEIVHRWSGIRYPDAVPIWRCPDRTPHTVANHSLLELIF